MHQVTKEQCECSFIVKLIKIDGACKRFLAYLLKTYLCSYGTNKSSPLVQLHQCALKNTFYKMKKDKPHI